LDFTSQKKLLEETTGLTLERDVPLREFTSFGIGGPAALFTVVDSPSTMGKLISTATDCGVEILILGGGTNLLVSDDGFDGIAVHARILGVELSEDGDRVTIGAGVPVAGLVEDLIARGIGGLEFAAGLPGTVGGAVAGNAGCFGSTFGQKLIGATVATGKGEIVEVDDPCWFGFDYRTSSVSARQAVVTSATFAVRPDDRSRLRREADEYLRNRRERHPKKEIMTAGSYFKNLEPSEPGGRRTAAGALLDQVGATEMSVGDAAVFEKHANIVINRKNATAVNVLELTGLMAARVKKKFGIELEPEVRFVGRRPVG
jgi:UDP-N-acetylmuramate dehydrogenase